MDHGEALLCKNFQVHVTRFIYNFCLYVPHGNCSVLRLAREIHVTTLVKDKLSGNNTKRHVHYTTYFHSFIKQEIPFISHRFCYSVLFMWKTEIHFIPGDSTVDTVVGSSLVRLTKSGTLLGTETLLGRSCDCLHGFIKSFSITVVKYDLLSEK